MAKLMLRHWKSAAGRLVRRVLLPPARFLLRPQLQECELLQAYTGLVQQAYQPQCFQPWLSTDVFWKGAWRPHAGLPPTKSPAHRERDNAVHHYGHDVVLKRYAQLPLVARPLPFLLEHGVNFSDQSAFEVPESWVRSYLCMGERRAALLRQNHAVRAHAVGPYIRYARSPISAERQAELKARLGRTLLVIPAHSTAQIRRVWSQVEWIDQVERYRLSEGYEHVLWMGFWKDPRPDLPLPDGWIPACNGHASNPWFLDCQRLLFELSDAVCTFALGTHIGYALELERPVLLARQALHQDMAQTDAKWRARFQGEQEAREALMDLLLADANAGTFHGLRVASARRLLDPWFGFSRTTSSEQMADILRGR